MPCTIDLMHGGSTDDKLQWENKIGNLDIVLFYFEELPLELHGLGPKKGSPIKMKDVPQFEHRPM